MTTEHTTYSAIVVDDEASNRLILKTLLQKECPEIDVVAETDNIENAFLKINELKPQLLFLDIRMPDGGGFSLLKKFNSYPFEIIFVTSYDQYALNAIKASALDYLLKPVERNELKAAVEKFKKVVQLKTTSTSEALIKNFISEKNQKVALHYKGNVVLVPIADIHYIEADINYSNVYVEKNSYYVSKTLSDWEEILSPHTNFIRVSKSAIINVNYCSHYEKGNPIQVVVNGGVRLTVSRRRRSEVLDKLKNQ